MVARPTKETSVFRRKASCGDIQHSLFDIPFDPGTNVQLDLSSGVGLSEDTDD